MKTQTAPMVNQVHTTDDYHIFQPIDGNRNKNLLHLNRLRKSMQENYLFTVIIVNENFQIIDGQHRFEIIRELGLPLHYIICPGYGLKEVHTLNANSKNWTFDDYMNGYCELGNNNYIVYRNFKNMYNFTHQICMKLLHGTANGNASADFQNGNLKISGFDIPSQRAKMIVSCAPYYDGYLKTLFALAMITLFEKPQFNFEEFLGKLKANPTALKDCTSVSSYIALIEEIYNYRRREKINLRY
jgi:hypothetical protein